LTTIDSVSGPLEVRKVRITGTTVAALTCPPGKKDVLHFDDALEGFGVRVSANGNKIFVAQYNLGKVRRRMAIGRFGKDRGQLTEPRARAKALAILGAAKDGRDPFRERQMQIAATEGRTPQRGRRQGRTCSQSRS
jgi:hypothetical protein